MRDALNHRWNEMGEKLVKLAEEFPEDHYEYRPANDVRTFADQLRHVAFWNRYVSEILEGREVNGDANELSRDAFPTKAAVRGALRESFSAVSSRLTNGVGKNALSQVLSFIEHNGEHYGQLVMYYRLNGLVPPASR
jgi:uncharacterized damage-inducible protein DinB